MTNPTNPTQHPSYSTNEVERKEPPDSSPSQTALKNSRKLVPGEIKRSQISADREKILAGLGFKEKSKKIAINHLKQAKAEGLEAFQKAWNALPEAFKNDPYIKKTIAGESWTARFRSLFNIHERVNLKPLENYKNRCFRFCVEMFFSKKNMQIDGNKKAYAKAIISNKQPYEAIEQKEKFIEGLKLLLTEEKKDVILLTYKDIPEEYRNNNEVIVHILNDYPGTIQDFFGEEQLRNIKNDLLTILVNSNINLFRDKIEFINDKLLITLLKTNFKLFEKLTPERQKTIIEAIYTEDKDFFKSLFIKVDKEVNYEQFHDYFRNVGNILDCISKLKTIEHTSIFKYSDTAGNPAKTADTFFLKESFDWLKSSDCKLSNDDKLKINPEIWYEFDANTRNANPALIKTTYENKVFWKTVSRSNSGKEAIVSLNDKEFLHTWLQDDKVSFRNFFSECTPEQREVVFNTLDDKNKNDLILCCLEVDSNLPINTLMTIFDFKVSNYSIVFNNTTYENVIKGNKEILRKIENAALPNKGVWDKIKDLNIEELKAIDVKMLSNFSPQEQKMFAKIKVELYPFLNKTIQFELMSDNAFVEKIFDREVMDKFEKSDKNGYLNFINDLTKDQKVNFFKLYTIEEKRKIETELTLKTKEDFLNEIHNLKINELKLVKHELNKFTEETLIELAITNIELFTILEPSIQKKLMTDDSFVDKIISKDFMKKWEEGDKNGYLKFIDSLDKKNLNKLFNLPLLTEKEKFSISSNLLKISNGNLDKISDLIGLKLVSNNFTIENPEAFARFALAYPDILDHINIHLTPDQIKQIISSIKPEDRISLTNNEVEFVERLIIKHPKLYKDLPPFLRSSYLFVKSDLFKDDSNYSRDSKLAPHIAPHIIFQGSDNDLSLFVNYNISLLVNLSRNGNFIYEDIPAKLKEGIKQSRNLNSALNQLDPLLQGRPSNNCVKLFIQIADYVTEHRPTDTSSMKTLQDYKIGLLQKSKDYINLFSENDRKNSSELLAKASEKPEPEIDHDQ